MLVRSVCRVVAQDGRVHTRGHGAAVVRTPAALQGRHQVRAHQEAHDQGRRESLASQEDQKGRRRQAELFHTSTNHHHHHHEHTSTTRQRVENSFLTHHGGREHELERSGRQRVHLVQHNVAAQREQQQ